MPEVRLIACGLMWRSRPMIGVTGPIAAESARYGIRANITIAAAAG
jgi:hypothetical protein